MSDLNLSAVDISFAPQIDFTYECDDGLVRSWPDHVLTLSHFMDTITDIRASTQRVISLSMDSPSVL